MEKIFEPISKSKHSNYSFSPLSKSTNNFISLINLTHCPIYLVELKIIATYFPIFFIKEKNGNFSLRALFCLYGNNNLYIDTNGWWKALYLPLHLRCLPFSKVKNKNSNDDFLCFISDSKLVSKKQIPKNIPFFDNRGNITDGLQEIMDLMTNIKKNSLKTQEAIKCLSDNDLIVEWPISLKFSDGEKKIDGLFKIDENKIKDLSKDKLLELNTLGSLEISYSQIISCENVNKLGFKHIQQVKNKNTGDDKNLREVVIDKQRAEKKKELDDLVQGLIDND